MDKYERYNKLVMKRKGCQECTTRCVNQSCTKLKKFDSNEINPWSLWHHDLNADLLVVGQDWGSEKYFEKYNGCDDPNNRSNRNLIELFQEIGIAIDKSPTKIADIKEPDNSKLFFTNAFLCLRPGGGMSDKNTTPSRKCIRTCCARYLKELIEIVEPKAVITLGEKAFDGCVYAFGITNYPKWRDIIDSGPVNHVYLDQETKKIRLIPLYHCGPLVINTNTRTLQQQKQDWQRHLGEYRVPDIEEDKYLTVGEKRFNKYLDYLERKYFNDERKDNTGDVESNDCPGYNINNLISIESYKLLYDLRKKINSFRELNDSYEYCLITTEYENYFKGYAWNVISMADVFASIMEKEGRFVLASIEFPKKTFDLNKVSLWLKQYNLVLQNSLTGVLKGAKKIIGGNLFKGNPVLLYEIGINDIKYDANNYDEITVQCVSQIKQFHSSQSKEITEDKLRGKEEINIILNGDKLNYVPKITFDLTKDLVISNGHVMVADYIDDYCGGIGFYQVGDPSLPVAFMIDPKTTAYIDIEERDDGSKICIIEYSYVFNTDEL
jgi:DNA polymerase